MHSAKSSTDQKRREEPQSTSQPEAPPPRGDGDSSSAGGVDLSDVSPGTEELDDYLNALDPGTAEYKQALRRRAAAVSNGESGTTVQKLEQDLAEEEERRRAYEYKIK